MIRDWTAGDQNALVDHLRDDGTEALEEHIRAGGSFSAYAEAWRLRRDEQARAKEPSPELLASVLNTPLTDRGQDYADTVRGYLVELLARTWDDLKYGMTGESDWQYDLYEALNQAGIIPGWRDGYGLGYRLDGSDHPEDRERADRLITAAIRTLADG